MLLVGDFDGDVGFIYASVCPFVRLYSELPFVAEYILFTFLDGTTFCTGRLFSSTFSVLTPFWFWNLLGVEWSNGEFGTWEEFGEEEETLELDDTDL